MAASELALIAGIVAVVTLAAELIARRILRRSKYFVWPPHYRRLLRMDTETFPQLEPDVRFSANAQGERGGVCPDGPSTRRILIMGGSAVESALNDQSTTWTAQLESLLNSESALARLAAEHVHVGNVGRAGLDVRGVDLILERTMGLYDRLDAIGLMVGPGDMVRWLEAGAPVSRLPDLSVGTCFAEHPEREFGWNPRRLALADVARRWRTRWLKPVDVREKAGRWMARARKLRREAKRVIEDVPDSIHFLECFEQDVDRLVARATMASSRVLVLRQPRLLKPSFTYEEEALFWNGGIGNPYRGDTPTVFFSTEVMYELLDRMDQCLQRVAAKYEAQFVDPMPALTMSAQSFYDHIHFTPHGARELATAIAPSFVEALATRDSQ